MPTDPWAAFDRLVMGSQVTLKLAEIKALEAKFAEEKLLSASGFMVAAAQLAAGNIDKFQIGDKIITATESGNDLDWIIIGKNQDGDNTLTVQTEKAFGKVRFCKPTQEHRYGWNHPLHNDMRNYLHTNFARMLSEQDIDCLTYVQKKTRACDEDGGDIISTTEMFFLLSASEAGFEVDDDCVYDEGGAYAFYAADIDAMRVKRDFENNRRYWWLRSPNPSSASDVRYVGTDGSLHYNGAYYAYIAVAPACVIKAKPIQ